MSRIAYLTMLAVAIFTQAQLSHAGLTNVANGKLVIGGNSDYAAGDFNTGGFYGTFNVTDGQNAADPLNNSGDITEPGQDGSYWLGRNGVATGYFVLDLGATYYLNRFELFNTRNGPFNDRGTGNFTITGSNTIAPAGGSLGFNIVGGTLLAAGTLTSQTYPGVFGNQGNTPLVMDNFMSADSVTGYRYLRFDALSIGAAADKGFGPASVGLNELRAIVTPEPSTIAVWSLVGLTMGGASWWRRRRSA